MSSIPEECAILARMPISNHVKYVEFMRMKDRLQHVLTRAIAIMPAGAVLINGSCIHMDGEHRAHVYAYMAMIDEGYDLLTMIELIRCTARAMKTIADREGGALQLNTEMEIEKMLVDLYNRGEQDI